MIPVPQPICEEEQGVGRSPGIAKEPRTSRQSNPAKVPIVLPFDDDRDDDDVQNYNVLICWCGLGVDLL